MHPENTREYKQQLGVINVEIKSLEESIIELRHHRNALVPISSLPPEVITTIFSFLSPLPSPPGHFPETNDQGYLAGLCVSHVCQQWRKIALNEPLLWTCLDYDIFTLEGAAEVLIPQAKTAPLHLEVSVPNGLTYSSRKPFAFQQFQNALNNHLSRIRHLNVSAEFNQLDEMLRGLGQHAPVLEYLSLCNSNPSYSLIPRLCILDTGTLQAPMLSCLKLRDCDISWESPLLKGIKYLDIRMRKTQRQLF